MEEGFYRVENGILVGPLLNIIHQDYTLMYDDLYPTIIDGWYKFNNKKDAYLFFGLDYFEMIQEDIIDISNYINEIKDITKNLINEYIISGDSINQEQYNSILLIYPTFKTNHQYNLGDVFSYYGKLYKVIQAHISQDNWIPLELPALYVIIQPEGVISAWVQPLGSEDSYQIGDKVLFNGFTWESIVNNNVWSPDSYGWIMI